MRTIQREIIGVIIESADNKFLFGQRIPSQSYGGKWVIIGGGIEEGEDELAAVIRETKEETGIDISNLPTRKLMDGITGETEKTLRTGERVLCKLNCHDFWTKLDKKSEDIELTFEPEEFTELSWFEKDEIGKLDLSPISKELLIKVNLIQP